jgi:hypothetical protein
MKKLIDKLIILIISLALYIPDANNIYMIVPILISIALSAILSYLENERIATIVFMIYLIGCFLCLIYCSLFHLFVMMPYFLKSKEYGCYLFYH